MWPFKSADKIAEGVVDIAKSGMTIWDASSFKPQEQIAAFKGLIEATAGAATATSRRHLLWVLSAFVSMAFFIGVYYIQTGQDEKLTKLLELVEQLYIGPGFVAAVGFYFLTHVFGKLTGK